MHVSISIARLYSLFLGSLLDRFRFRPLLSRPLVSLLGPGLTESGVRFELLLVLLNLPRSLGLEPARHRQHLTSQVRGEVVTLIYMSYNQVTEKNRSQSRHHA